MLKHVELIRKANGNPIFFPIAMDETGIEQQVKLLIEMADYSSFDAHMHLSLFHHFYGNIWTFRVIEAILHELRQPRIEIQITRQRSEWITFFEHEHAIHRNATDEEYRYPPQDAWRLPM